MGRVEGWCVALAPGRGGVIQCWGSSGLLSVLGHLLGEAQPVRGLGLTGVGAHCCPRGAGLVLLEGQEKTTYGPFVSWLLRGSVIWGRGSGYFAASYLSGGEDGALQR